MGNPLDYCKGDAVFANHYQMCITDRIMRAWQKCPSLRLAQFIYNAISNAGMGPEPDPFYVEDAKLVEACEAFASEHAARVKPTKP